MTMTSPARSGANDSSCRVTFGTASRPAVVEVPVRRFIATATLSGGLASQRYQGSAWRGKFAQVFKRLVCVLRHRPCAGCPLERVCLYPRLFGPTEETAGAARPFIIHPQVVVEPREDRATARLRVTLSVFPPLLPALGYLGRAFEQAVAEGPDRYRGLIGNVRLEEETVVLDLSARAAPLWAGPVAVTFETPLRLRLKGDLVVPERLTPAMLVHAALRRARALGLPLPQELAVAARTQAMRLAFDRAHLRWCETRRYSSRQDMLMAFGGVVGRAELDLTSAAAVASILEVAAITHLGKGACMGFGRIALHPASVAAAATAPPHPTVLRQDP